MRKTHLHPLLLAVGLGLAACAIAQAPHVSATGLALQGDRAYRSGDYVQAAACYEQAVARGVKSALRPYRGACAYARVGNGDAAFSMLQKAVALGFHDAESLEAEAALSRLRTDSRWSRLAADVKANEKRFLALHADPEGAKFVTSDVDLFWKAYAKLPTAEDPAAFLDREYLDAGSVGLQDFIPNRIQGGANLDAVLRKYPRYFAAIRENTLKVASIEPEARQAFRNLKRLYDDAIFPDVYFVVGSLDSGGTATSNGLLLGVDMFGCGPGVPLDEMDAWHRAVLHPYTVLPNIIAHELIHFQQKHEGTTLLAKAFHEGSADLVASLISNGNFNAVTYDYGYAHEAELWKAFQAEMRGTDASKWLYGSSRRDGHPADLGYFMGFRIAQAYYRRSADKKRAVRDILASGDFERILKDSHYGENLK